MKARTRGDAVRRVSPRATAREAAFQMREAHVGFLVVVDEERRPLGVLTDRDVALGVLTSQETDASTTVEQLMTAPAITIREGTSRADACALMREKSIRKLPVVDERGRVVGVLTADDLLFSLGKRVHDLSQAVRTELSNEAYSTWANSIYGEE